jgi:hypothetical protein
VSMWNAPPPFVPSTEGDIETDMGGLWSIPPTAAAAHQLNRDLESFRCLSLAKSLLHPDRWYEPKELVIH